MDNLAVELEENTSAKDGTTNTGGPNVPPSNSDVNTTTTSTTSTSISKEDVPTENNRLTTSLLTKVIPSRGMLMALLASVLFSGVDVSIELATHQVHPNLVLTLYPNVIMLFSFICIIAIGVKPLYSRKQYLFLVITGGFYASGITCLTLAISKIPVGDAVAILNCMPIFGGIFGWILLKQSLRLLDLLFGILCITGVVLIARPSFIFPAVSPDQQSNVIGALFALAAACFIALAFTAGRKLQDIGIHILCILFSNAFLTLFLNAILCTAMNVWSAPSPSYYWAIAIAPGFFDFFAQIAVFMAVRMERAVMVTVILTSEIIFTFVLQILIVKIIPHWYSAIGSFLILMSCIGMASTRRKETGEPGLRS